MVPVDLRILGAKDAPAILSLLGPDDDKYADYTYNGSDADTRIAKIIAPIGVALYIYMGQEDGLKMIVLLFLLVANMGFSADWEAVQRIQPNTRIAILTGQHQNLRGRLVSATETVVVVQSKSGEQSIDRGDIRRVLVADPSRRRRIGVLASVIGAGIGLAVGVAICPHCGNEGAGGKYTVPFTLVGAGVGAVGGFVPLPYRTVYKSK